MSGVPTRPDPHQPGRVHNGGIPGFGTAEPAPAAPQPSAPRRQLAADTADGRARDAGAVEPGSGASSDRAPDHLPGTANTGRTPEADGIVPADQGPLLRLVRRQELAFAVVGAFNTLLGIVLTVAWLAILGDGVPPSVAVVAAYCLSVVVAFVLHRTLVFRVRGRLLRDFLAFVAVNSGGLLMNVVLLELAVTVLGFPEKPAAVVVMGFVAVVSFFGHRHISFRRRVG
ncbi:GtrA family protein [Nocardia cyriacigeorgica]|uniref:GtrA family protein n=1 Tax=Nocardia cyriacigeorgica TaxID=135487 RepID=UPI002458CEF2|nr:GtrA family protein [Nocardia cyriacigeorgica]